MFVKPDNNKYKSFDLPKTNSKPSQFNITKSTINITKSTKRKYANSDDEKPKKIQVKPKSSQPAKYKKDEEQVKPKSKPVPKEKTRNYKNDNAEKEKYSSTKKQDVKN